MSVGRLKTGFWIGKSRSPPSPMLDRLQKGAGSAMIYGIAFS